MTTSPPSPGPPAPPAGSRLVARDVRFAPLLSPHDRRSLIRRVWSVGVLLAIDVSSVFLGLYAALALKQVVQGDPIDSGAIWTVEQQALPLATITLVLVFAMKGLYASREERGGAARVLASVTIAMLIVAALVLASGWRFQTYYIFYSSWLIVTGLVVLLRTSYDSVTGLVLDMLHFERRAVLVGEPAFVEPVAESLERSGKGRHGVHYRVVARHELAPGVSREGAMGSAGALRGVLDPALVDEVILTGSVANDGPVLELLDVCRRRGLPVRLAPTTAQLLSHSLRAVPAPGLPLFELRPPVLSGVAFLAKRAFDLVMGGLLLVLLSPLLGLAALAVKLHDGGPVLFRSRRMGVDEHPFDCVKFRTMHVGAESRQADLEARNEADGALFKVRDDPRVTPVGRVLRRLSIDELPQLVNVMRGEMSLVGPRPLPERDYLMLDDLHKKRYLVLPGMTGLWQVSGRSELSFDELVRLDFFYIESWSVWLDLVILARTIPAVLGRRGAY